MFGALSGSFDSKCRWPNAGAAVICANFLYDPITIWATTFNLQIGLLDFKAVHLKMSVVCPTLSRNWFQASGLEWLSHGGSFQKTWIQWVLFFGRAFAKIDTWEFYKWRARGTQAAAQQLCRFLQSHQSSPSFSVQGSCMAGARGDCETLSTLVWRKWVGLMRREKLDCVCRVWGIRVAMPHE